MSLTDEVDGNFSRFSAKWREDLSEAQCQLEPFEEQFKESYRRIASIQSWRANILEVHFPGEALGFFEEAQNDLLSGHILACSGGWRYALKSLRSFIENSLSFLYFKDHPVELERWQTGKFRIGFSDSISYLEAHPRLHGFKGESLGLGSLKKEYGTLSRAVHASGGDFRMTKQGEVNRVFLGDGIRLNKWATRESDTVNAVNTLYLFFFRDLLKGASERNHRKAIGLTLPEARARAIKKQAGVSVLF
jgi:hypothetical protein